MEQFQIQGKAARRAAGTRHQALVGVNASGNLEILVERVLDGDACLAEISTAVGGFRSTWEAVLEDFFGRASPGGLRFSINDGGARPDTVMLRLLQGLQLMEREP